MLPHAHDSHVPLTRVTCVGVTSDRKPRPWIDQYFRSDSAAQNFMRTPVSPNHLPTEKIYSNDIANDGIISAAYSPHATHETCRSAFKSEFIWCLRRLQEAGVNTEHETPEVVMEMRVSCSPLQRSAGKSRIQISARKAILKGNFHGLFTFLRHCISVSFHILSNSLFANHSTTRTESVVK
jgi:hypothetical protein